MPCYEPAAGWSGPVIEGYKDLCKALPDVPLHLILVNDGSRNGIFEKELPAIQHNIPFLTVEQYAENRGKGYALRAGVARSTATYCIYTDIDIPYQLNSMIKVYEALIKGNDVAAGVKDADYYTHVPTGRKFVSRMLRALSKRLLGLRISDTQCGLKGFNTKGKQIFADTHIDRYLFDLEFIWMCSHNNDVQLTAVPVTLRPGVQFSHMRMNILFTEAGNFIRILFSNRRRKGNAQ
ncbi:MAG: glycosyltransferase [Chitinophagales bacterium]